ncbi:MAG: 5-formyltetrahydrofolate cyclo-ligase [Gammaproteobacteria bacterium]
MNARDTTTANNSNASKKISLRRDLIARREGIARDRQLRNGISENAINYFKKQHVGTIFCYLSTDQEAPTWGILEYLLARPSVQVSCPRIGAKKSMLAVHLPNLDNLERGPLGIFTSPSKVPVNGEIDIAIVPGLGFTRAGARLGYGGGYYDRWFEKHPTTKRVALCFEAQLVDDLPTEPHDREMDTIITESTIYDCHCERDPCG